MSKQKRLVPYIHAPKGAESNTLVVKTISRNDPCPCGSKKKVKNCHPELMKRYYYQAKEKKNENDK